MIRPDYQSDDGKVRDGYTIRHGDAILLCRKCHEKMRGKEKRWAKQLYRLLERKGA